ncbi:MAG: DNA repair protein RecO [Thermoleophilia bacterium]|jgi:DNA repair protein RecO (recombination protein O)
MGSRFFTTEALVIGSMRYREADRIVTLYTKDRGRVGAVAKGVRRTRSKVGGRLEPYSLVQASLHCGRGLYTVCGVETLRTFQGVRDELFRMEEGARLLGAVRHLFPAEEGSPPAFNLLVRGVARLAEAHDAAMAAAVVLAVRLKLLVLLGYAPETTCCAVCGSEEAAHGFSPRMGGVVCEVCAVSGSLSCVPLSSGVLATLRTLMEGPLGRLQYLDLDDRAAAEVQQVLTQTLAYHGH